MQTKYHIRWADSPGKLAVDLPRGHPLGHPVDSAPARVDKQARPELPRRSAERTLAT